MEAVMKPADAFAMMTHRKIERVEIDQLEGRITASLVTPYPPGIPLLIPGERFNKTIVDYLKFTRVLTSASLASIPMCMAWPLKKWKTDASVTQSIVYKHNTKPHATD